MLGIISPINHVVFRWQKSPWWYNGRGVNVVVCKTDRMGEGWYYMYLNELATLFRKYR